MSKIISERQKRRHVIINGISQDLDNSEIAAKLGVNRWVIINDIRFMRKYGDSELKQAQEDQEQVRAEKRLVFTREKKYVKHDERFIRMTGMTLKEKSFRNMIDFHKHVLMKILKSRDQNAAIMKLPKSIRKTLKRNGIITKGWHKCEITSNAREYIVNT